MSITRRELTKTAAATLGALALGGGGKTLAQTGAAPATAPLRLQRLSWAGVRIETPGLSLFIDVVADPALWNNQRAVISPAADSARRAALVTHLHNDHFDPAALKSLLGDTGRLCCSRTVAVDAASRGLRVSALDDFQPAALGELVVQPVPAVDGFGDPQVSWIVRAGDVRLIHCGDTVWHGRFDLIGRACGPFDVAFLPINGVRIRHGKELQEVPSTLTPEEAVAAAKLLRAARIVPIHYGASNDDYVEQTDAAARLVAAAGRAGIAAEVVAEGGWVGGLATSAGARP